MGKGDIASNVVLIIACSVVAADLFRTYAIKSDYRDKFSSNMCNVSDIHVHNKFGVSSDKYVLIGNVNYIESGDTYNVTTNIDKVSDQSKLESLIEHYESNEVICYTKLNQVHIDKPSVNSGKLLGLGYFFIAAGTFLFVCVLDQIKEYQNRNVLPLTAV